MSSSAAATSDNLSDVLGSVGQTTDSASATGSASNSGSASASASGSGSGSATATSRSASGSATITNAPTLGSSSSSVSVSSLTGAPSLTSGLPGLTDLPTLSGFYSYPAPTVPPTQNAPYMQRNNLPENFVFIIVGAVIAFVALVIIAWRVLTSWSINRRFGTYTGTAAGGKASYTPLSDFKSKPRAPSTHDMKDLGHLPKNFSSVPSLFFSPTAEVARHSTRPPSNREPSHGHLPAGHYRDASRQ